MRGRRNRNRAAKEIAFKNGEDTGLRRQPRPIQIHAKDSGLQPTKTYAKDSGLQPTKTHVKPTKSDPQPRKIHAPQPTIVQPKDVGPQATKTHVKESGPQPTEIFAQETDPRHHPRFKKTRQKNKTLHPDAQNDRQPTDDLTEEIRRNRKEQLQDARRLELAVMKATDQIKSLENTIHQMQASIRAVENLVRSLGNRHKKVGTKLETLDAMSRSLSKLELNQQRINTSSRPESTEWMQAIHDSIRADRDFIKSY